MTSFRVIQRFFRTTVTLACAVALVVAPAQTASAQDADGAGVRWSATHGTAEASGTRWVEGSSIFDQELIVRGELRGTGSGCYSVWVRWVFDLAPGPERRHVTVCGGESAPVDVRGPYTTPTTTAYLRICRGQTENHDCGATENLTSWPIEG